MAVKKKAVKKTAPKKTAAKKTSAKKPVKAKKAVVKKGAKKAGGSKKGDAYVCTVCGLGITVNTDCGCVESCDIICCDTQMKKKK